MRVVITIPAYNEERTIGRIIHEIKSVMALNRYTNKHDYNILVVNDGSKDRTAEIARQKGAIVYSNKKNLGLAETFKIEMQECLKLKPDVIVHTDADGQYPSCYIPQLIKKVEEGYDLVLGSRFGKGRYRGSFIKKMGNKAFAIVFSNLLKTRVTDTTTGFRAFTKEVAGLPFINNFTYTQEQLIRAGKSGLSIAEIPIKTRKTRKSRLFKNPLDYALKAWVNILRIYRDYEPLKFFGYIGGAMFVLGFILGVYVILTVLSIGETGGIPRVILSALLMLTGLQIVIFGFLADMKKE